MDSLMEFICAYKNTAILAIVGVLIQIVIALPAGYAIARIPSPKAQTFFLLTCVFFCFCHSKHLCSLNIWF